MEDEGPDWNDNVFLTLILLFKGKLMDLVGLPNDSSRCSRCRHLHQIQHRASFPYSSCGRPPAPSLITYLNHGHTPSGASTIHCNLCHNRGCNGAVAPSCQAWHHVVHASDF